MGDAGESDTTESAASESAASESGVSESAASESGADPVLDERRVLTVGELNELIADTLDVEKLSGVRCRGEVSDLSVYDSAVYFDLVGEEATVNCFVWRSRYDGFEVDLETGDEVVLEGSVDYYVDGGRVNLKPWSASVVGEGETATALKELRIELAERGWFDDAHKRPLPRFPERIGLVTSAQGDARHDVCQSLHDRYPGVDVLLCHAAVQGKAAPTELADGIHRLDRHEEVDVIVVGRGGGSDTDLRAFDSEPVAEAIFTAETPVVAAVGHREDETIAGEVADAAAITPTDAGELVVEDRATVEANLDRLADRLDRSYEEFVDRRLSELERELESAHERHASERMADLRRRLEAAGAGLERARAHRQDVQIHRARVRRYRIALVAVLVLAVLLATALVLLLL